MRTTTLFITAVLGTALFACSSADVKASDFAPRDGGVTQSGDGGVKTGTPIKSPSTTKDAGASDPKPAQGEAPTTCKGAVECLAECEEEAACDACYGGMSDGELKELQDISLCIADSGCTTDECVAEVCADVIDICMGN